MSNDAGGGGRTNPKIRMATPASRREAARPSDPHTTDSANIDREATESPLIYKPSTSEFNTAMVHFYRGEVQRANTWRNRLDTTTNWAVLTTGATLSFAFSAPSNPHFVIIINTLLVAFFLFMEARRYRYYEVWSSRVRMIETGYFARLLSPDGSSDVKWMEALAADLRTPHFTISEWEALGRRLRRNYMWLFLLLAASWNLKVYLHPRPADNFDEFIARATVGVVPGEIVFLIGVVFNVGLIVFALATIRLREATGEVLPEHEFSLESLRRVTDWTRQRAARHRATLRRAKRARARIRTATGEWRKPKPLANGKRQASSRWRYPPAPISVANGLRRKKKRP